MDTIYMIMVNGSIVNDLPENQKKMIFLLAYQ